MLKHLCIFIGLLISSAVFGQSNSSEILFERLPIPGQIQSSQVNEIVEDKHGLLWIASDGLYRYDGYRFKVYTEIAPNKTIAGKEIVTLWPDRDGKKLYIGTHSHGLVEYDYATDKFSIIPAKEGVPIISLITQTTDGTLWCGSFSNGLYYVENDTLRKLNDPKYHFNNPTHIMAIGNTLYVDKLKHIFIVKNKTVVDTISINYPGYDFAHFTRVTVMNLSPNGTIWIGTERAGVFQYDTLTQKFLKYFPPDKPPFYHRINKIITTADEKVWILTKANGLVVYDPKTDTYQHLTKNPLSEQSLGGNNCSSIIQDKNGIIWVGATGDLNKYDPGKIKFRHIYNNPFGTVSLNDNMVRSVYEDQFEKLWIGTDGGVVHIFDKKKNNLEKIPVTLPGVSQHIVPMCFQDLDANTMLIGTSFGLLQFNKTTKKFSFYGPLENRILKNRLVRQILYKDNMLYFIHTSVLFIYNLTTKELKSFAEFGPGIVNGTTIYIDSKNRLWVGGRDGISLYNEETETFKHFAFEKNLNRPVGSYFMVLSIIEHQDKLWVGTFNTGLWVMDLNDLEKPTIKNFTIATGLPDNTVYGTLPDSTGNLWLSTNKGIVKFELHSYQSLNFNITDGIQHEEFNRLAFARCKNGEMVFGGINGVNIFNPEQIAIEEKDYTPTLMGVSVFNQQNNSPNYISLLNQNTQLALAANQNNLEIQFFIPNYCTPKRYEVLYKLSNFNPDWVKTETNQLYFANLRPGRYELKIKTVSDKGLEKEISFPFIINHPFWQTWWFILLVVIFVTSTIYWLIRFSISKAKYDKAQLEKLLRLRTQEIEKSREELANLNQKKDVIFSILSHDLRSPLTTLKGFLSILIENSEYLTKEELKRHATNIRNSVTSSLDLIDNTLFWSLSQTGNITYTPTNFSLNTIFKKVSNLYQLTIEKKQIRFTIVCSEETIVYADENMIYVTLRNLVSNAIKFTSEDKAITIQASIKENHVEISVKDEGIGMSESYLNKLLHEEHLQVKMGTSNEKGTGLGIVLCKRFIALNNGELTIKSEEGKGSEFILTLPLAQEAVK
jgi:signal transduction histidine kinase/ligand-binding sensor domain-containing protein